jgi:invasion protein IalB
MTQTLRLVSLAALIAFGAPASAQDSATPAPDAPAADTPADAPEADAPAETAAPTDPAAALGLDMGRPVDDGTPRAGQPYVREQFTDWSLRCIRAAEGPDPCDLYQLLRDADGNAVAEISVFPLPAGGPAAAGATIVAPLETLLTEDLLIAVDGGTPRRYPFSFCNRAGCIARIGFTADEVTAFKRGASATLRIVPALAPDQPVTLTISLRGFTAGFEATDVFVPPAP